MEEETSRQWSCSTNWIVSEGSFLEGSVSFETSEEDAPALTSNGLVLFRPTSDDPPPCEVTIFLRQTHEIHRIYARTTARTFEVYYAKDSKSDTNEYLCTVKCGPASPGSNSSVHSSEEETWVAVKNPEEIQMHYEATAEISDVDPCLSLTLRFLSLQKKSSIHIEEIYIFADPLEISSSPKSSGTNTATNFNSSMFAMLVPNLLQMSKSGFLNNKINDQYFSSDRVLSGNNEKFEGQSAKLQESGTREINPVERNDYINQVDEEICINSNSTERVQNANNEKVEDQTAKFENPVGQKPSTQADRETCINTETINNNNNNAKKGPTNRVEKLLEQLVSKVDKMENYFLKFEEKMLGPITNIELRLFNLENKFDEFAGDLQSLKVPFKETEPDPVWQDDSVANGVTGQMGHSRSVFRAPDFVTDSDTDTDDLNDDDTNNINNSSNNNDNNDNNNNNNSNNNNKRKPISIDGALASALAAFASGSKLNKFFDINDDLNDQMGQVGDINIPVKSFLGSEGVVPLVSIDDVKIETVSDPFDPFVPFKEIPQESEQNLGPNDEFERNLGQIDGFEREISELDRNLGPIDGFEREIDELGQSSDQIDRFEKGINELGRSSDRIDKFEREINELGQNSGKNDGFEKGINELDESSDKIDGFERKINELDQNSGQIDGFETEINELDQILGRIDEDFLSTVGPTEETTQGPEGKTQNEQVFFYKSAISEISDEEDLNFEPDLTRFKSNSTLNNSSSNSSFDESFLKTRVRVDLSDSSSTESGIFTKKPLENCEIGIGSSFIPLEDLFGDSNLQGPVFKENCSGYKGPLIDLEEENLVNSSEAQVKDDNMKLFESLI